MSEKLEKRLRAFRSRIAIREWEYRQRHHAKGVWYRIRRVLADAERLFVISEEEANTLIAEGFVPEACFRELEPQKTFLFIPGDRVPMLDQAREIRVSLDSECLDARFLAAVPFRIAERRISSHSSSS
jgi:hypothetical protein